MRARLGLVGMLVGLVVAQGCGNDPATGTGDAAAAGSGGSGAGGAAGAAGCHGDAAAWAAITQGPIACTKASDCCVVVNPCVNQAQVVGKADFSGAPALWPYCDGMCTACIAPAVDIVCDNGQCGLVAVDFMDASPDQSTSRCGVDATPVVGTPKPLLSCGG